MNLVAVTLRSELCEHNEQRDCLDERWSHFLHEAGFTALMLPNHLRSAQELMELPVRGVLLTGGGDLMNLGGTTPSRDSVERMLIALCSARGIPLLGVCRGMQALQAYYGQTLERVEGHIQPIQEIQVVGAREQVNSYHTWGSRAAVPPLEAWAHSDDKVVKAVRHSSLPMWGIMWHPERIAPFRAQDIRLFQEAFA